MSQSTWLFKDIVLKGRNDTRNLAQPQTYEFPLLGLNVKWHYFSKWSIYWEMHSYFI